jgi:hypothetical protein
MAGENLDLSSEAVPTSERIAPDPVGRRYVGIHFLCCDTYARVYVNRNETAYEGNCPRCAKPVTLRIGPNGTEARFFTAG